MVTNYLADLQFTVDIKAGKIVVQA